MSVDEIFEVDDGDVVVAFGFYPYVQKTIDLVSHAAAAGAAVVAITDASSSPLILKPGVSLLFSTSGAGVVSSMTAAITLAQILVAQLVSIGGAPVVNRIRKREKLLAKLRIFTT
jgi:DNA-binding MurR/RpiR family transcriptional regulator